MENKGVFIIYTGGTIGSMPRDPEDPNSPQVVVKWEKFMELSPKLSEKNLGFRLGSYSTEPLDSCNIGPKEWKEMADAIQENYDQYEGFVIIHGTDTMVNTASALSFMLQNLGKPVVITGAQLAYLFNLRNDGWQNLIGAIQIANPKASKIPVIPEVGIYFNGKFLRGNRARKMNASGLDAYQSPNYPPLAVAGESIAVDTKLIRRVPVGKALRVRSRLETQVIPIYFFPGIQDSLILQRILDDPKLKGVVLLAYGAGNIPTKKSVLEIIHKVTSRTANKVVALDVTQCGGGKVELGMYETSALLLDAGVVSGVDITPEAALTKLMVLLGDEDLTSEEVALLVQQDLAGEQSLSIFTSEFKNSGGSVDAGAPRFRIPATDISGYSTINEGAHIERVMLRLRGGYVQGAKPTDYVYAKLFIDLSSDAPLDETAATYLGEFRQLPNSQPTILFFDISETVQKSLSNRASFTIALQGDDSSIRWESIELVLFLK